MRLKAKIYRVSEVAEIPIDGTDDMESVRKNVLETAAKFPGKLDFKKPEKNEKIIVQIEQVG
jgi:hypothetical protein